MAYVCAFCEQGFIWTSSLSTHIKNRHKNVKPFQCDSCEQAFISKAAFETHSAKHNRLETEEVELSRWLQEKMESVYSIVDSNVMPLPLGGRLSQFCPYTLIDANHFDRLADHSWTIVKCGGKGIRITTRIAWTQYLLADFIKGAPAEGNCYDHLSRKQLDNRGGNLEENTLAKNSAKS